MVQLTGQGANASYLTWNQVPDTVKFEAEGLTEKAYALTNTPRISFEDYQDRTGTLRQSNEYEVDETGLTLKNETEYASYVEAKEFDVLSGAALEAERILKEKFE